MTDDLEDLFVGSRVGASVTFSDEGVATNPTTVSASVRAPDGTETAYAVGLLQHPATGVYALEWDVDQPGRWYWRFEASGVLVAVIEGTVDVPYSRFEP